MFPQDAACQILLKLVDVLQRYSKNKNGDVVLKHSTLLLKYQRTTNANMTLD